MPELPEVEVVRRGLAPLAGRTVEGVNVIDERAVTRHLGGGADFEARLVGRRLGEPQRRGKFLWVPLGGPFLGVPPEPLPDSVGFRLPDSAESGNGPGEALLIHLGMSGQVLVDDPARLDRDPVAAHRHERVRILLDDGTAIAFADQRTFGSLALDRLVGGVPTQVAHIARDPLDPAFPDREFVRRIRGRRTEVKRALLDQTLVSGIGNIYADEALWSARIHPRQPTGELSAIAAGRLLAAVREVIERALVEGGTSFDALYVNVNGQSGYFSRSLRAYGQQGRPCARCGRAIVRESFMNRGSHYCPHCQRIR